MYSFSYFLLSIKYLLYKCVNLPNDTAYSHEWLSSIDTISTHDFINLVFYSCNIGYLLDIVDNSCMYLPRSTDKFERGV